MASKEDVQKLASLSRISIPDEKLDSFAKEFDGILAYVGKLDELSLPEQSERAVPVVRNVFREDGTPHEAGKYTEKIATQFPKRDGNSLEVKQIITHE